ncbi:MAG TPA: ribokinase [Terriglobia bacterium]|nr:ribokinase [Terriglobia bacterium]
MRSPGDVRVVVVGSMNFDLVVKVDRMVKEGESLVASNLKFFPGGKGANQAVGVARQGAQTHFVGAVGEDVFGDFLVRGIESNGIDATWVKRDANHATGCAFIMVFPHGNNSIIVDLGANSSLTPADVERAEEVIAQADALSTVFEIPMEVVEASLRLARKHGKLTVLDAGPPRHCPPEILRLADIVSPNETELEELTDEKVTGRDSAQKAAEKLLEQGANRVVLKLGSDGSMLVTRKGSKHFPACKIQAVDPTAAGDSFTAALTVQLAAGADIEGAIQYANYAGALAALKLGAQPSLPTRKEVEEFAAQNLRSTEFEKPVNG